MVRVEDNHLLFNIHAAVKAVRDQYHAVRVVGYSTNCDIRRVYIQRLNIRDVVDTVLQYYGSSCALSAHGQIQLDQRAAYDWVFRIRKRWYVLPVPCGMPLNDLYHKKNEGNRKRR